MALTRPIGGAYAQIEPLNAGTVNIVGDHGSYTLTATPLLTHFDHWEIVSYDGHCEDITGRLSDMTQPVLVVDNTAEEGAQSGVLTVKAVFTTGGGGGGEPPVIPGKYILTTKVRPNRKCGTINPSVGYHYYNSGTTVTVSASATDRAYKFKHLLVDGSTVLAPITQVVMNSNHTVIAEFELKYHGNLYTPSDGGKILCSSGSVQYI